MVDKEPEGIEEIIGEGVVYRPIDLLQLMLKRVPQFRAEPFLGEWAVWCSPGETKTLRIKVPDWAIKIPLRVSFEVYTARKFEVRWWRDEYDFYTTSQLTPFSFRCPFPFEIFRECGVEATNTDADDNWIKVRFSGVYVDEELWEEIFKPVVERMIV